MHFLAPARPKIVLDSNVLAVSLFRMSRKLAQIRSYDSDDHKKKMTSNNTRFLVVGAGIIAASLIIALIGSLK